MSAISFSLFNGERAVVLIFLILVIFSAPRSLFFEVFGLSVLAAAALALEIHVDGSDQSAFKSSKLGKKGKQEKKETTYLNLMNSRPGASSGILLGSVTLPTVLVARLTQLFRVFPLYEDVLGELEYLKVQYWAACCCSLGVLTLLCRRLTKTPNESKIWELKFESGCIILHGALCSSYLIITSSSCFDAVTTLLLVFSHGLATVRLTQHVMKTFPLCASIGEAILVVDGLVLYLGDVLARTVSKTFGYFVSSEFLFMQHAVRRNGIYTIIQGLLLGFLICPVIFKIFDQLWKHYIVLPGSSSKLKEIGTTITFFSCVGFILVVITPSWMAFVHDFRIHPYLWVLEFVLSEPLKIISLCIYWTGSICLSVTRFYNISKSSTIERILLRKYYHLLAVSMFLPALIFQPEFLNLAFGVALSAFVMLEIIRVHRIWPLGQLVHHFMNAFTDHRDSDLLIVSHFSLLLGCALPMWMSSKYNDRPLAPFAGILSLGVGDTMASVVGHKYGVLRWSKNSKKTIEGTAAGITCVLASCSVILPLLTSTGYILTQHWQSLVAAVTVSGLLEAYTTQLDNAFIPLVFYSLLCL